MSSELPSLTLMGKVDATYPLYAGFDPVFYDKPRFNGVVGEAFALDGDLTSSGWRKEREDVWTHVTPLGIVLPEQGWKIHVSATSDTSQKVVSLVSRYCHQNALPFKFLSTREVLGATLAKDADRRLAGKFMTIYPPTAAALEVHLTELDKLLAGLPGPYVLSDIRWKKGPLYVRYGAFVRQFTTQDGVDVPAVRDLRTDVLVPDVREARFYVPPWVEIPSFIQAELDQLDMGSPSGFPKVQRALHFSNAGGVYEAMLDEREVVLKEARPHTGQTPEGRDAVQRLREETALLQSLQGRVPVPTPITTYDVHGHMFLAMDRVEGETLNSAVASRHPLVTSDSSSADRQHYKEWALAVVRSVRSAVAALHACGQVHGDLHPANILVRDDRTVVLIDLEMSRPISEASPARVGAPGFVAMDGRSGVEQDLYALACIELFMFIPLIPLLNLDESKPAMLVHEAAAQFELQTPWCDLQLSTLARRDRKTVHSADRLTTTLSSQIAETLIADATPNRLDRLWPGDPRQFHEPSTSVAHGALGILSVLHRFGLEPSEEHLGWVDHAITSEGAATRPGLMDGLAGKIRAYRDMGMHERAQRLLSALRSAPLEDLGHDLYGGLPGVGLTLLAEAPAQRGLLDLAAALAMRLRQRWRDLEGPTQVSTGAGGLMNGATGTALFALRLFETTGDQSHLRTATEAMDFDLHSLRQAKDGSLQVDEGWRLLPYLANGSAGIGAVLAQLITHLPNHSRYLEVLDGIRRTALAPFTAQSGLFEGRAGLIQFLLVLERAELATAETSAALQHHVAALQLHALHDGNRVRFPGNGMLRASCDFATGAAGVLATLIDHETFTRGAPQLSTAVPFLGPLSEAQVSPRMVALQMRGGEMNGIPAVSSGA